MATGYLGIVGPKPMAIRLRDELEEVRLYCVVELGKTVAEHMSSTHFKSSVSPQFELVTRSYVWVYSSPSAPEYRQRRKAAYLDAGCAECDEDVRNWYEDHGCCEGMRV